MIFMLSEVRLEIFFEKIKNKGPKIHYFALKFTVGPPNLGVGGARAPGPPPHPGSASGLGSRQFRTLCNEASTMSRPEPENRITESCFTLKL